jgi:hypothetical protein
MLPEYGVVIGRYTSYGTNQGQWMHVDLSITANGAAYQAAVDVNEPTGIFEYLVLKPLDSSLFAAVVDLPDGYHRLLPNPTSGAIDYARSSILQMVLGGTSAPPGTNPPTWDTVTGNEAGEALVELVTGSTRVFVFGAPYTTGLGVHDVHCNQGDPPGRFRPLDGIWQDGCVFVLLADGTLAAYLGKFSTQTLATDDHGLPA